MPRRNTPATGGSASPPTPLRAVSTASNDTPAARIESLKRWLFPLVAEDDPVFRADMERRAHTGLQAIGWLDIGVSLFFFVGRLFIRPDLDDFHTRTFNALTMVALGVVTLLVARVKDLYSFSRWLALVAGWLVTIALLISIYSMVPHYPAAEGFITQQLYLVMMVAVAVVPAPPVQMLLYGVVMTAIYAGCATYYQAVLGVGNGVDALVLLSIVLMTLLISLLSGLIYGDRLSSHRAHKRAMRALEELRNAETRNLLSEHGASLARLTAALSHELNSPIGALSSGVDTLMLLTGRQATADGKDLERVLGLQADVRKSIRSSAERLRSIAARMQRFSNLDRAEVQPASVNDILSDVTALLEPNFKGRAVVELDLNPVPKMLCRPQQLSAVFHSLLTNSLNALNGDGRIRIHSERQEREIMVSIEDNGHGVSAEDMVNIFDPGFRAVEGRVVAGNWSMFSSRQVVREHGGEIRLESAEGKGTKVFVTLPC